MANINELRENRAGLIAQMRGILDVADKDDKRALTAEEVQKYDAIEKDVDAMDASIQSLEETAAKHAKLGDLELKLKDSAGRKTGANSGLPLPVAPKGGDGVNAISAFREFLAGGLGSMSLPARAALQGDIAASGGNLIAPEEFRNELIKFVDNLVFLRSLARVLSTDAQSVGVPSLENDPADANWTGELSIGTADSTMSFGKRTLTPHDLAKSIRVSRDLLRASGVSVESLVMERLGYKFAVTEEQAFMTGSGSQQPLGIFTASVMGITTARDTACTSQTAIDADAFINCKFSLKSQYMMSPATRWIMHRDVLRNVRKLKDGNGQYLWQAGLGGTPDTILEVPYILSEYAPNTFTSGLYMACIGDFSNYWICDSLRMEMQRLDELYAASNEVGFVGRLKTDGMPVLAEAFARLALA